MTTNKILTPSLLHTHFGEPETIWQIKRRKYGVTGAADLGSVWSEMEENLRARLKDVIKHSLFLAQTVPMAGLQVLPSSSV